MNGTSWRHVSLGILLTLAIAPTFAKADDDGWLHEFDEAVAAAKQQGKDILIDFSGTDWCMPCQQLWTKTLSQPEFVKLASDRFVLLDIDNLFRGPMPAGRKERYEALEKRFGIQAHPTVVLATADGLPYASTGATWHDYPSKLITRDGVPYTSTGLIEDISPPAAYWQHLQPFYERGQKFKAALAAAGGPAGLTSARTIVDALSQLRPDFVIRFYPDKLDQLRKLAPLDETGYLAFLDARAELLKLEWTLHERWLASLDKWEAGEPIKLPWVEGSAPADVDQLIEKHHLQGAALQEALLVRTYLEIDAGKWPQALATLDEIGRINATPSQFDQANFVQIFIPSGEKFRDDVRAARELSADPMAQLRALYPILDGRDIQCVPSTWCCNHSFTEQMHYLVTGAAYAQLLLDSTAQLRGEERAKAIAKGLEGIELVRNGPIGGLLRQLTPGLVSRDAARKMLPAYYLDWIPDYKEEIARCEEELKRNPSSKMSLNTIAWFLATASDSEVRDGGRALEIATRLTDSTSVNDPFYPFFLEARAAAYAEQGDFESAVQWQAKALERIGDNPNMVREMRVRLELYKANKPFRE